VAPAALDLLCRTQDESRTKKWRAAAEDPEKWLFLDTETTGLSGGTGTYAFLIGIAWWDSGGLQLEQFMMRDFSEEHSVLLELGARIAERPVLVTFQWDRQDPGRPHWHQAFSADGGESWEINWHMSCRRPDAV